MSSSSVQVVVRLRPMNEKEKKHGTLPVIKAKTQEKSVTVIKGQGLKKARSNFNFDNVFSAFSTQEEVFDATLKPVIRDVMQGYESTVFAYGQTGTGKTYTMEGNLSSPEHYGIIPRSAQAIFETLKKPEFVSYNIVCTYLEIYNEELCDLLADEPTNSSQQPSSSSTPMKERHSRPSTPMKDCRTNNNNLNINSNNYNGKKLEIMNGKNGTFCRGLSERQVKSASDVFELMQRAQQLRKIGETKMNKESSRSHCVFSIIINANKKLNDGSTFEFSGKLHMVDLAGSECAKTAGLDKPTAHDVARERERKNINQSLLTLGRVIKTLKEQSTGNKKSNVRIPYRDSKLTRILQESLGGRCKTLIIATLSPSVTAIEESMSTLSYAQEANGIVNKPVSSSYLSLSSSQSMESSCGSLEPNSVEHWQEMECRLEYMQAQVEEAKAALARKHMQQQELVERAERAEVTASKLENEVFIMKEETNQLKQSILKEKEEKEEIKTSLKHKEVELQKTTAILQATQHTEVCLTSEAKAILKCLEQSIKDGDELYNLLSDARNEDINKRNATKDFRFAMESILDQINVQMNQVLAKQLEYQKSIFATALEMKQNEDKFFSSQCTSLKKTHEIINSRSQDIQLLANGEDGIKEILVGLLHSKSAQIKEMIDFVNQAKEALTDAIGESKGKVQDLSKAMTERTSNFTEKSDTILASLETNIEIVKGRFVEMTAALGKGLEEVLHGTSSSRKEFHTNLTHINDALQHNLTATGKMTLDGSQNLKNTLQSFCEEKKCVNEAKSALKMQRSFMGKHQPAHTKEIEQLKSLVASQREMLDHVCNDQRQLQQEFLNNTFARMQQLMQEEMKRLSDLSEKQKLALDSCCESILSQNSIIDSSTKAIFGNIRGTNNDLLRHLTSVEANETKLEKAAIDSINAFACIENCARAGSATIQKHVVDAKDHAQMLSVQEGKLKDMSEKLYNEKSNIQTLIDNDLFSKTTADIWDMKTKGTDDLCHAKNSIVSFVDEAMQQIEEPQIQFSASMEINLDHMSQDMERTIQSMEPVIDKQNKAARSITEALNEHKEKFQKSTDSYKNVSAYQNQSIVTLIERIGTNTTACASSCQAVVGNANSSLGKFSQEKIKAEECVHPLAERSNVQYSERLSSTPADDVIIEGLDFSENDETRDSISLKSHTSCTTNTDICSSQDSSPSIEPNKSCSNKSASPLTELSINKENIETVKKMQADPTNAKPRHKQKHHGKKRSNSRPPTEYRKRIPLTPSRSGNSKKARNGSS